MNRSTWCVGMAGVGLVAMMAFAPAAMSARQSGANTIRIDSDDLGGVVTSAKGPEAGVWVIAENLKELPTPFRRIVVTDAQGRYVVPDLPKATYSLFVRGYGLVDSTPVQAAPGKLVNLTAVVAPSPRAAAQYYPPHYWWSLMEVPAKSEFPGTGLTGNGILPGIRSQADWIGGVKNNCLSCHQIGDKATREIPASLGVFASSLDAWDRRVQSGQIGASMNAFHNRFGRKRLLQQFADWTDRVAAGELPPQPPRPQGRERNVVITLWDWSDQFAFNHDTISTDKRNPMVNANGPVYNVARFNDPDINVLDPTTHKVWGVTAPIRDADTPFTTPQTMSHPSPYWGEQIIWTGKASIHNPMMDHKGRVWTTHQFRAPGKNPDFCKAGSNHPSAKLFPLERITNQERELSFYDPAIRKWTLIDTCFGNHHLQFAEDANHTLWTSGAGQVIGWVNTKLFDETGDAAKSQGWTAFILDTNGNGKRDEYVEPDQPLDPSKDKRIRGGSYGIIPSPVDGSIWIANNGGFPGQIIRVVPGANPPATTLAEVYEPPPDKGYIPRGIDIDRNGLVWVSMAGSGHLASFDRRKCKVLNGPTALGAHCPEGWTMYLTPGPKFKGASDAAANTNMIYYNWVDQFDVFGLGRNTPFATGTGSESLLALMPDGEFLEFAVPYPMGFYHRGVDGRIDDPKAGWKGRGLWANYGQYTPWHYEGGKGTLSKAVKFQLRPDPLAH